MDRSRRSTGIPVPGDGISIGTVQVSRILLLHYIYTLCRYVPKYTYSVLVMECNKQNHIV